MQGAGASAETVHVFRHALLREAAYELQLPADRGALHALALDAITELCNDPARPGLLDAQAAELAVHARLGYNHATDQAARRRLGTAEAHWLNRAALAAERALDTTAGLEHLLRLADSPWADAGTRTEALVRAGEQARLAGRYDLARQCLQRALAQQPQGDLELRALGGLGVIHMAEQDMDRAEELLTRVLAQAEAGGHTRTLNVTQHNLGLLYRETGRLDEARRLYDAALALARQTGNERHEGSVLNNLGVMNMQSADLEGAAATLQQALDLHRRTGNARSEVLTLLNLGEVYRRLGRFESAGGMFAQGLALSRQYGMRRNEGQCLGNQARLALDSVSAHEAVRLYRQALEIHRETDYIEEQADMLLGLGQALAAADQVSQARAALVEARQLAMRVRRPFLLLAARFSLARLDMQCRRLEGVRQELEHVAAEFGRLRDHRYQARVTARLAELDAFEQGLSAARPTLLAARDVARAVHLAADVQHLDALLAGTRQPLDEGRAEGFAAGTGGSDGR